MSSISTLLPAWQMLAAAIASDSTVRDNLISLLHAHAGTNASGTLGPFPNVYNPTSNEQWEVSSSALVGNGSGARFVFPHILLISNTYTDSLPDYSPAQGAMYAFLALEYASVLLSYSRCI